jgi:hypothetical protein
MPTNDFLPVAIAPGANVMPQAQWVASPIPPTGFTTGLLPSPTLNKAHRQSSFVAAGIAQMMMNTLHVDVLDDGNFTQFVSRLTSAIATLGATGTGISEPPTDANIYGRAGGAPGSWVATIRKAGDTMTGLLVLSGPPTAALGAVTKQYADAIGTIANNAVPLAGGTMSGPLILSGDPSSAFQAATKRYVDTVIVGGSVDAPNDGFAYGRQTVSWQKVVPLGGTGANPMTGPLLLSGDPTAALGAATKQYVDRVGGVSEAPSDGTTYGRQNGIWDNTPSFLGTSISGTSPGSLIINRNTAAPPPLEAGIAAPLRLIAGDSETQAVVWDSFGGSGGIPDALILRHAAGTNVAPQPLGLGAAMGSIAWRGYGAAGYGLGAARLTGVTTEDWTTGPGRGSGILIQTTQPGATAPVLQASFGPGLTVGNPTQPIGGMQIGDLNVQRLLVQGQVPTGSTTPGTGGIPEAPSDGTSYSRQSGAWTNIPHLLGAIITGTAPGTLTINRNTVLPAPPAFTTPSLRVIAGDGESSAVVLDGFANVLAFMMRSARGTATAPAALQTGDQMGNYAWRGYGTTGWGSTGVARISATAAENWTDAAQGTQIQLWTTPIGGGAGGTTPVVTALLGPGLTVGNATAPIGGNLPGDINAMRVLQNGNPVTGIADAFADSTSYARQNNLWTNTPTFRGTTISGTSPGSLIINRGATLPTPPAGVVTPFWVVSGTGEPTAYVLDTFAGFGALLFRRANTSATAPSHISLGDQLGNIAWRGYSPSGYTNAVARFQCYALEDWTDQAQGVSVQLQTTSLGGANIQTQATFGPGLTIGGPVAPTTAMQTGDLNANRIYVNGVPVATATGGAFLPLAGGTISGTTPGSLTIQRAATLPAGAASANPVLWAVGAINEVPTALIDGIGGQAILMLRRANGSGTTPIALGDILGQVAVRGYGTTGYHTLGNARLQFTALEPFTDQAQGTKIEVLTTPLTSAIPALQATFGPGLTVGSPSQTQPSPTIGDINAQRIFINGQPVAAGSGILDATSDSTSYSRQNNNWVNNLTLRGLTVIGTAPGAAVVNRGTAMPPVPALAVPTFWGVGAPGEGNSFVLDAVADFGAMILRRANGTVGSPLPIIYGDQLGNLAWRGHDTTDYTTATARFQCFALESWTDSAWGSAIQLQTTPPGQNTITTQATFGPGLTVGVPTPPPGGMLIGDVNAQRVLVNGLPITATGGGSGTPGGSPAQVQYNTGTGFGGSSGATFNGSALTSMNIALSGDGAGDMYYRAASGALTKLTLGTAGQILGVTGSAPAWQTVSTGSGTVQPGTAAQLAQYPGPTSSSVVAGVTVSGDATIAAGGVLSLTNAVTAATVQGISFNARGLITGAANQNYVTAGAVAASYLPQAGGTISGISPGQLIINRNTTLPPVPSGTVTPFWVVSGNGETAAYVLDTFANFGSLIFRRANGTPSTLLTQINSGDQLGNLAWRGYDGSAGFSPTGNARFQCIATQDWIDANHRGTAVSVWTTPTDSGAIAQQAVFSGTGLVVGNPSPPSGGAVFGDINANRIMVNGAVVGTGSFPEATSDGTSYSRQNAGWTNTPNVRGMVVSTPTSFATAAVSGSLIINRNTAAPPAIEGSIVAPLRLVAGDLETQVVMWDSFGASGGIPDALIMRHANNTNASPAPLNQNDAMGAVAWRGYGQSGYGLGSARVMAVASEAWTGSGRGSAVQIWATQAGGPTTPTLQATYGPAGLTVGSPTGTQPTPAVGDINCRRIFIDGNPFTGGSTTPGGSTGNVQYNTGITFGGSTGAIFSSTQLTSLAVGIGAGSDQTGDLYYRNASGLLARLPLGNPGYLLQVSGGLPSWQPVATGGGTVNSGTQGQIAQYTGPLTTSAVAGVTVTGAISIANGGATSLNSGVVGYGNIVAVSGARLLGSPTGGTVSEISLGASLQFVGSTLNVTGGPYIPTAGGTISGTTPGTLTINRAPSLPTAPTGITAVPLWVVGNNGENTAILNDAIGIGMSFLLRRANGTLPSSLSGIIQNDLIGNLAWRGYDTSPGYTTAVARIGAVALQNFGPGAWGTQLTFSAIPFNSATLPTSIATMGPGLTVGSGVNLPPAPVGGDQPGDVNCWRLLVQGQVPATGSGSPPGGAANQVQYYLSSTTFGGSTGATFSSSSLTSLNIAIAAGADATGDIWYRAASGALTRVPSGSNGNLLQLVSGLPSWQPVSTGGGQVNTGTGPQIAQYSSGISQTVAGATMSGDVTIAQGGVTSIGANRVLTAMINNNAVSYAKMQTTVSAAVLLGNPGVAGTLSEIPLGAGLNFSGGALVATVTSTGVSGMTSGQIPIAASGTTITSSANLSGDVVSTATTLATLIQPLVVTTGKIANLAVTYAKMQNVALASRLLGNPTVTANSAITEIPLGNNLTFSGGTTLAVTPAGSAGQVQFNNAGTALGGCTGAIFSTSQLTQLAVGVGAGADATGDVWFRNASGNMTRLAIGTATQVLTVSGGLLPSWAAPTGGGGLPLTGGTITGTAPGNVIVQRAGSLPGVPNLATPTFWAVGNTAETPTVVIDAIAGVPGMILRRANVTGAGPIQNNDVIGNIGFRGFGGSQYALVGNARILVTAIQTFDDSNQGTKLDIVTTPLNSATPQVQATFDRGLTVGPTTPVQATPTAGDLNCMRLLVNGFAITPAGADTISASVTAATGGQGTVPLTSQFNVITTCPLNGVVTLRAIPPGDHCIVRNSGANPLGIYPSSGVQINNQAVNAILVNTVLPNSTIYFEGLNSTQCFSIP